jgi:cytochrome c-type biogenesis protein CcmF
LATGRHVSRFSKLRQGLTMGGALSVWGSQLLLLKYILDNNFSYKYVLEHSSTHLSLELKLSVLWVGQEGSLLLWTSLLLLFYFVFRHIFTKYIEEKIVRNSFIVASLLCLTFITITIISNPFALTDDLQQEGWGLNPLLRTVWNVIHPPVVFMVCSFNDTFIYCNRKDHTA